MWFKNLFIYRLHNWNETADSLHDKLAEHGLPPCGGGDLQTRGWVAPKADGEPLVFELNKQLLISLGVEKKLLPTSVVKQFTQARVAEIEEREGYKPGRKQVKDIKEAVVTELLPRAFVIRSRTYAWINPVDELLIIDAGSPSKAEDVMSLLMKSVPGLALTLLKTKVSPGTAMTQWLTEEDNPRNFTVDQDCELRSRGEQAATIRYVKHSLDSAEVARHIQGGKTATRLALTWADRVSFVLQENLQLKRLAPLDVLKESAELDKDNDAFDTDFALMSGELRKLIADVVNLLGGELKVGESANQDLKAA
ncbi:recombination-associated protein RdgC [Limnobacter humi]|uniref:Recombination-associated protein RdgC n=1 Tax=Limnobacter humi TaxID=1778671 RepID=A0ABT1WIE9_9BURK|nr:recombination-associated protein RdgC [Limnobacter humi]MCQ8897303.1 recombination-associated protein RdgC [Limnobacter humi]